MPREREAVIWCPKCRVEKFEVWREPTGADGVHTHVVVPADVPLDARKFCACGAVLERKR